jgi:nitric oxide dioxygenase|eukprot:TRINITY_DN68096_c0_g1_i1.p1 TRINITY_DN68096_c0_g1~~TRINITY_DN68096_c0_g1_i1.p1  ORF type:complete len:469 (+),score=55.27 TRINITY_DN68096_c0_g1_i1:174-1409(+)
MAVGQSLGFLDAASVKSSLPKELSVSAADLVKQTAPLLVPRAEEIAHVFYRRIFEKHTELHEFFNFSNQHSGRQQRAFGSALVAFASTVEQPRLLSPVIDLIAAKHCALSIQPHHYLTVHEVIMASLEEALGPAMTPAVGVGWGEAILFLAGLLIKQEDQLYTEARARNGGWLGFRRFIVARREEVARDVVRFTLKPADARGVYFDFSPGQFVSVKVDPDGDGRTAPRHYTVTSQPGMPCLQICVKRVPKGKVSNYLLDRCSDGQELLLSPPFGTFTAKLTKGEYSTAVLVSAGIGVTPMLALLPELQEKVVLAAHVERSEDTFVERETYLGYGTAVQIHYTSKKGRPGRDFAASLVGSVGVSHDWYICGPSSFMVTAMRSLTEAGVDATRIHFEVFGPQLCPAQEGDEGF